MAKVAKSTPKEDQMSSSRPALTAEGRENQLIALAMNRAEQQLIDGTASSQVITHFLKLGTEKERLERAKIENETLLLQAKVEALKAAARTEELYANAIQAMGSYHYEGEDNGTYSQV